MWVLTYNSAYKLSKNTNDSSTDSTTLRFDMLTDGANTSTIFRHKKHKDTRNPIYTLKDKQTTRFISNNRLL